MSSSQINLQWTNNSDNELGFKIELRKEGETFSLVYTTKGLVHTTGPNVTSYNDTGLEANTTYYYRVRAYNTVGDSAYSNEAFSTTWPEPLTAPETPSGLMATAVSHNQIDLTWQDNADNEDWFKIERKKIGEIFGLIHSTGANTTSWSDTGIDPDTTYYYRVLAYNSAGDSLYSNESSATTNFVLFTNFRAVGDLYAVAIDSGGGKWFGTSDGASYLDDNNTPDNKTDDFWTIFTPFDGLVDNTVNAIAIDSGGGKWFGTYDGGVSYLDDNGTLNNKTDDTWTSFTTNDGLVNNTVFVIAIDSGGGKWFGTRGSGVSYLDDNATPDNKSDDTWTSFTTNDGLVDNLILFLI